MTQVGDQPVGDIQRGGGDTNQSFTKSNAWFGQLIPAHEIRASIAFQIALTTQAGKPTASIAYRAGDEHRITGPRA